ncbi:MAG: hypothetical protein KIT59_03010 [Nitrosomonas sp.]|uniref:hypothetical protein n=1 Tax=Nitrosomonas nitrosa TaxID=52442 RepID=UPI00195CD546|nr:hypothetical protein [Nitrosomonas nitrosa]MCW5598075.1 hypothetical protein [Nitrosomonas sp.]
MNDILRSPPTTPVSSGKVLKSVTKNCLIRKRPARRGVGMRTLCPHLTWHYPFAAVPQYILLKEDNE